MNKRGLIISVVILLAVAVTAILYSRSVSITVATQQTEAPTQNPHRLYSDILTQAWDLFRTGNAAAALEKFNSVVNAADSTKEQKVQANFGIASVYEFSSPAQPQKAAEYFERIIQQYPQSEVVAWAMLRIGQIQDVGSDSGTEKARSLYRQILEKHSSSEACDEAVLALAATYFAQRQPQQAAIGLKILEDYVSSRPDNILLTSMLFRLSYWYQEIERDYNKGLEYGLMLGEIGMCNPNRQAMQYWGLGQMLSIKFDKPQEALKWYDKVVEQCPRDYLTYAAAQKAAEVRQQINISEKKDE